MQEYVTTLLTIVFGAVGYLLVTFWFQPILRYRDIKYKIASDLVYYANTLDLLDSQGLPRPRMQERMDMNRKRSAELEAVYKYLPRLYRWWLKKFHEDPQEARRELIGLSNEMDGREAMQRMQDVRRYLRLL